MREVVVLVEMVIEGIYDYVENVELGSIFFILILSYVGEVFFVFEGLGDIVIYFDKVSCVKRILMLVV